MENWTERILAGDPRAIARAATAIENRRPEASALLRELFPHTGRASIVGITGAPGAGKSTLTDQLARVLRRGNTPIGIIAVDPSSPFTGGAILGDRIRMQQHHADPGVFIRSMATRGQLGGLARGTFELAMLLDAAGRETILIETVGVGQGEVEITKLADVTVVVLTPGMGDDIQALKAGIMEIAGVFVINKADQPGVERFEQDLRSMLAISPKPEGAEIPIVRTVAGEGIGIEEAVAAIRAASLRRRDSRELWMARLLEMVRDRLMELLPAAEARALADRVAARELDPYSAVDRLVWAIRQA